MSKTRRELRRRKGTRKSLLPIDFPRGGSAVVVLTKGLHALNVQLDNLSRRIRRHETLIVPRVEAQTIDTGVITLEFSSGPRTRIITVDTEGAAATDDVDSVNGSNVDDLVIVKSADSARDVRLTNAGNLKLGSFGFFTLLTTDDRATFHSDGTNLYAISLRNN